jgi:hypothetical protein
LSDPTRISAPDPKKPPLKNNIFQYGRVTNTALAPLFPYAGDGDILPALSIFWGGKNRDPGVFQHTNSVDEVAICYAAEKSARMKPGFVHVGARTHTVGGFFDDASDPEICRMIVVTQRQSEAGVEQSESLTFLCEKCQTTLLLHKFASKVENPNEALPGYEPILETLTEGARCLEPFNADPDRRRCQKCDHVNPPFPVSVWGWDVYRIHTMTTERGRRLFVSVAQPASQGEVTHAS